MEEGTITYLIYHFCGVLQDIVDLPLLVSGESVNILTYELSTLQATFAGWKTDGTEMLVKDMTTPACAKMPSALLRTTDILAIEFKNPVQLP